MVYSASDKNSESETFIWPPLDSVSVTVKIQSKLTGFISEFERQKWWNICTFIKIKHHFHVQCRNIDGERWKAVVEITSDWIWLVDCQWVEVAILQFREVKIDER